MRPSAPLQFIRIHCLGLKVVSIYISITYKERKLHFASEAQLGCK